MIDKIRRTYEMLLRVIDFMSANAADFSNVPYVAATVTTLQTETAAIGTLAAEKVYTTAVAKDSTISRADARFNLHDAMEDIAEVWRSAIMENSEMSNKFKMPRGNSDQNTVATAKTFAVEAEQNKQFFLDRGMPADFITDLQNKTAVFENSINSAQTAKRERVGTNASFDEPLKKAKDAVRNLEPIVKRTYRENPAKTAEWAVASRVERHTPKSLKPPVSPQTAVKQLQA